MSDTNWYNVVMLSGLIGILIFVLGASLGSKGTSKEYQIQAISNNFAHWEVNVNGEVTFKWNVN